MPSLQVHFASVWPMFRAYVSCCYCCCCCWQHVRLPPRGVVRFLGWHVLKLEFWHFAHPKLNLGFVFASVFAVFSSNKTPQPARCTVQKHAQLSISHRFFRCFPVSRISHRFLQCFCRLSTFCTCRIMPASTCICFSALCGGGGGDGGGVMTSMRMRLLSSVSFVALLLKRCRLLCEALVAPSYCFSFETSTMQKPRVFAAFQTKTSKTTQKINLKKSKKSMVFATLS